VGIAKQRAKTRILKSRFDKNYRTVEPQLVRTTVAARGVGRSDQPYNGDMGQFRREDVVVAENIATQANPYLVAKHVAPGAGTGRGGGRGVGSDTIGGLTTDELEQTIRRIADNLINPPPRYNAPENDVTDDEHDRESDGNNDGLPDDGNTDTNGDGIPDWLEDYIRAYQAPAPTSGGTSFSATVPANTMTGDYVIFAGGASSTTSEDIVVPSGWTDAFWNGYSPNGVNFFCIYKVAAGTAGQISTDAGTTVTVEYDPALTLQNVIQRLFVLKNDKVVSYVDGYQSNSPVGEPNTSAPIASFNWGATYTLALGFYVIISRGNLTITPVTDLWEWSDAGEGTCSLFLGYRFFDNASSSPLMACTQSDSVRQLAGGVVFEVT